MRNTATALAALLALPAAGQGLEPRTPVTQETRPGDATAAFITGESGSYRRTDDLAIGNNCRRDGIFTDASDVTLDLNGFRVDGNDITGNEVGIRLNPAAVEPAVVRNTVVDNTFPYGFPAGNRDIGPNGGAATSTSPLANIVH